MTSVITDACKRPTRRAAVVVLAVFVALGVAGVASASIPDSGGVIHGCRKISNPAKGAVIVIDSDLGETCPSGTASLNWSQTGPQGPIGATGPQGVSGYQVINVQSVWSPTAYNNDATALCPTGKVAIGGGGVAGGQEGGNPDSRRAFIERSVPVFDGTNYVAWLVGAHRDFLTTEPSATTAYVICAAGS